MKKLFKFLVYVIVSVIGLLVLAAVALKFFIDPNDYREQIAAQASKAAGREIKIEGDLSLSVFPWLGVELGRISIGNPAGFDGELASVNSAGAAVKLLPLIGKNIEINRIMLDGLNANLLVDANGLNNWSGLGGSSTSTETNTGEGGGVGSLSIAAIDVSNGAVTLDNIQSGQRIEVSDIHLNARNIASGRPFTLDGGLLLDMPAEAASYALEIGGSMLFDQATGQLNLDDTRLTVTDRSAQPLPAIEFMITGELNSQTEVLNFPEMALTVDDLNLTGEVTGRNVFSEAQLNGAFDLAPFNPTSVAAAFGTELPELTDDGVMQRFAGQLQLAVTPQSVRISNMQASLDDSTLSGEISMLLGDRPDFRFGLNVDQINLDRYMPVPAETTAPATTGDDTVSNIPVETFRAIDANGAFSVDSLTVNNLNARNISIQMQADRNGWRFNPISADFYEGRLNGSIAIDATGDSPVLRADDNLNQVVAQAMLADMLGTDFLDGLALFDADINTDLNRPMDTLTGEVSFDIRDGAIKGINVAELLRKGFNIANNLTAGAAASEEFLQGGGQTDFASLSGRFVADNGVITNNDLRLLSPLLRVQGEGMVDLPNDVIDYRITAALVQSLQGQGGAELEQLTGKQIPIHITGSVAAPKYSVDPRAILQILAGQRLQDQKDQLLDRIGERLGGDDSAASGLLDNVLSDALGTRTREETQADAAAESQDSAAGDEQPADDESQEQPSVEEQIGGALLNSLFNRRQQDDEQPSDEESDDGNRF